MLFTSEDLHDAMVVTAPEAVALDDPGSLSVSQPSPPGDEGDAVVPEERKQQLHHIRGDAVWWVIEVRRIRSALSCCEIIY